VTGVVIADADQLDRNDVASLIASRDERAFRALYARHAPALYALALHLLGDRRQDAEDVVQEMWIRALSALPGFAWHSSLRSWLSGILLNCCRELWRTSRQHVVIDEAHVVLHEASSGRIDVASALARLPAGYRAVLVLHDVEGYTHDEIARALDIEPGTSKSQLFYARRAMRRALGSAFATDR
jgi:RNA polymerase sigma-70 factor, ECF subfamily